MTKLLDLSLKADQQSRPTPRSAR